MAAGAGMSDPVGELVQQAREAAERARRASNRALVAAVVAVACSSFAFGFSLRGLLDGLGS